MKIEIIRIRMAASLSALAVIQVAVGAPPGQGSILGSVGNEITEYGPAGSIIQSINVPYPVSPTPASERVRDMVVTQSGQIAVFNGTFDPYVSLYDPALNTWQHATFPGWSTGNNARYGGIASLGPYVFVSDSRTFGDNGADEARGVIRFDTRDWTATRFETVVGTNDVNLGLDGLLYAIGVDSTDTSLVKVFDPVTLSLVRTINLSIDSSDFNGIAVNATGHIYAAGAYGNGVGGIYEFDPTGNLLRSVRTPADSCRDIDIAPDGRIIFGARLTGIWSTDEAPVDFVSIPTIEGPYVAFPTFVPEPSTIACFALGGLVLMRRRRASSRYPE